MESLPGIDPAEGQAAADTSETEPMVPPTLVGRLSYTDILDRQATAWLPAAELADRIGANTRWIHRLVNELGIDAVKIEYDGRLASCYPPFALPILKDEFEWRREIADLPAYLTVAEIAERLGRSWGWTIETLVRLGIETDAYDRRNSRVSRLYSKGVLKRLRQELLSVPLDDGFYNLHQLEEATGEERQWIERRLAEAGLEPELRRSGLTGKLHQYYPPFSQELIRGLSVERPGPGGRWLTADSLTLKLGKSYNWLSRRLSLFEHLAEKRLDDQQVPRLHYPPVVAALLKQEIASLSEYQPAGDYLTFSDIARTTGRSKLWVKNRLARLDIKPEQRLDKKGKVRNLYPPVVLETLASAADDFRYGSRS